MDEPQVAPRLGVNLEGEVASLHAEYSGALLQYARAMSRSEELAWEGIQEAFLRYFIERSYGREINHPKAWMFEVLRNYLRGRASALSVQREIPMDEVDSPADSSPDPEFLVGGMQTAQKIAESLSGRELECLRLRTEGLSYGEIGLAMQVRTGTVGALLARAHKKIRRLAGSEGSGPMIAAAIFHLIEERPTCTVG
jgi:RNA polymerase sigma-70 factor (ECF subfamily)